jgi:transcription termination/antitermination protein NusG
MPALNLTSINESEVPRDAGASVWLAVQTWPRYEKKVAAELEKKQMEVFLPLVKSERQWSDRRQTVEIPLFPTYLFLRAPETFDSRISVLRTNGVINFLGARNVGTPVPQSEIESVRILLARGIAFQDHSFLNVGQRVRIRGSSLDGVEGILVQKNEDLSLVVSIQIIQRSLSVRVAGYRIEAA